MSHYNIRGIDFSIFQVPLSILAKWFVCQQACGDASSISDLDCSESFCFHESPVEKRPMIYLQTFHSLPCSDSFSYISDFLAWIFKMIDAEGNLTQKTHTYAHISIYIFALISLINCGLLKYIWKCLFHNCFVLTCTFYFIWNTEMER